jgi:hypothetical protein
LFVVLASRLHFYLHAGRVTTFGWGHAPTTTDAGKMPAPQPRQAGRLHHKIHDSMQLHRRLKPVAAADGGDFPIQRRMPGVAALLDQVVGGLALRADLHKLLVLVVVLPEVAAQAALAVVNGH